MTWFATTQTLKKINSWITMKWKFDCVEPFVVFAKNAKKNAKS